MVEESPGEAMPESPDGDHTRTAALDGNGPR
jgi:hypothetical protein